MKLKKISNFKKEKKKSDSSKIGNNKSTTTTLQFENKSISGNNAFYANDANVKKKNMENDHKGHLHMDTYFINKYWTWGINISAFILATMLLLIRLIRPADNLEYFLYPAIWIFVTSILLFTTGFKYFKTYSSFKKGNSFSVNLLMAIAAHSMFIYSVINSLININKDLYSVNTLWPAIIYIIVLMDMGHTIEGKLNKSSQAGFDKLKQLKMRSAKVVLQDGQIKEKPIQYIKVGTIIKVGPGEIVPLDGILQSKQGILNTSNITGESKPSNLTTGKYVISGSVNIGQEIFIKTNKNADESTITRIITKVENAASNLSKPQKSIDKFVNFLIPFVLIFSLLVFVVWLFLLTFTNFSVPWFESNGNWSTSFLALFAVLDVAAPCALGMAIPLVTMVTSFIGGENSIVFNSTKTMDTINTINIIAFDKTGTLTEDRMEIKQLIGDKSLAPIVKALEESVHHPLARSLYEGITKKAAAKIENIKVIPGKGVTGVYKNKSVRIAKYDKNKSLGNFKFETSSTIVALFVNGAQKLVIELVPKLKPNLKKTLSKLFGRKYKLVMITGDNYEAAKHIADKVGIADFHAQSSPEDKLQIIKKLKKEGKVMYIGDGFNDLAAIKAADISVSFASGDEILNELSDISLISNDINVLLKLLKLAKLNTSAMKYSLGSIFTLSAIFIPLAAVLIIQPWLGAVIMVAIDIIVVMNAWLYKKIGSKRIRVRNLHINKKY